MDRQCALHVLALLTLPLLLHLLLSPLTTSPLISNSTLLPPSSNTAPKALCSTWVVVSNGRTPSGPPGGPSWCLLVVGPPGVAPWPPGWQRVEVVEESWLPSCPLATCALLSWARPKDRGMAGHLAALQLGARQVVDLGAGVERVGEVPDLPTFLPVTYPTGLLWAPELPELSTAREQVRASTIAVLHSSSTPSTPLLAVGQKTFLSPGLATLYREAALWALLLPSTPRPEATRAYLMQKVLWRLGLGVALAPGWQVEGREEVQEVLGKEEFPLKALLDQELVCGDVEGCLSQLYSHYSPPDLPLLAAWFTDLATLGLTLPSVPPHRTFAYLTQGSRLSPSAVPRTRGTRGARGPGGDYDTFYLSFRQPSGDLFFPNSTFQQGRNALLRLALAREQPPGYSYFIFTDEDVELKVDNRPKARWRARLPTNPWRRFEEWLLYFRPMVGFAQYGSHGVPLNRPFSITTSHDLLLGAFHRDTLALGMPLMESPLDWLSSWNYDYLYMWFGKLLFSRSAYQCNSVRTMPGDHRYNNRKAVEGVYVYRQGVNWRQIRELLEEHIDWGQEGNPLGPLFHRYCRLASKRRPMWRHLWGDPGEALDGLHDPGEALKGLHGHGEQEGLHPGAPENGSTIGEFGYGLHPSLWNRLNICGSLFRFQALWWRSPLHTGLWKVLQMG